MKPVQNINELQPTDVVLLTYQEREVVPHVVEEERTRRDGRREVNLKHLYPPDTPDQSIVFADRWVSDVLDPRFSHLFFGNLKMVRAEPSEYSGWKFGSYRDLAVHTYKK